MLRWWKDGNGNGHDALAVAGANGNGRMKAAAPSVDPPEPVQVDPPWLAQLDRAGIPRTLRYPSTTLGRMLDQTADRFGDSPALIYNHKSRWT
jgi:hypothetical protein